MSVRRWACQGWRLSALYFPPPLTCGVREISHPKALVDNESRVGLTLSQATKALRENGGIALLYFRPLY